MSAPTAKRVVVYEGSGSAIENYFSLKPKSENWAYFDKNDPKHKLILSLLRQAQWVTTHPRLGEVADLDRFSDFLKSDRSPVKKPLKKMSPKETEKIITALEGIIVS